MKVMMFGVFFHFSGPVHARLMSSSLSIFLKNERSTRAICRCSEEEEEERKHDMGSGSRSQLGTSRKRTYCELLG